MTPTKISNFENCIWGKSENGADIIQEEETTDTESKDDTPEESSEEPAEEEEEEEEDDDEEIVDPKETLEEGTLLRHDFGLDFYERSDGFASIKQPEQRNCGTI